MAVHTVNVEVGINATVNAGVITQSQPSQDTETVFIYFTHVDFRKGFLKD